MKKKNIGYMISVLLILVIFMSACGKKEEEIKLVETEEDVNESVDGEVEEDIDTEKIILNFNNLLEAKANPEELVDYTNENIDKVSVIDGNYMVAELEKALESFLDQVKNNINKLDENNELVGIIGNEVYLSQDNLAMIKNDELREEVSKVINSKYKLSNNKGEVEPKIDYEDFKKYNENISPELAEYIEIRSRDLQKSIKSEAPYEELAEQILKIEEYIKQHSEGQRYEEVLKMYRSKLISYLRGIDNYPIYSEETGKIQDEILENYKKTSNTKDTVTGFIVRKHIEKIEEAEYKINDNIKKNILSLVNEALDSLETNK